MAIQITNKIYDTGSEMMGLEAEKQVPSYLQLSSNENLLQLLYRLQLRQRFIHFTQ
jgi:hypothetical protein